MLTTISLVAAVLAGSVSGSPYKYGGYGAYGGYEQSSESSTKPTASTSPVYYHSTAVIPTGSSISYSHDKPVTGTGPKPYSSGVEYSYTTPAGTGSVSLSTGYTSLPGTGHGPYSSLPGTGYGSSSTTLVGTGTTPSGTGTTPIGTGTTPIGTGTTPIGTGTTPIGTGTTPIGTGTVPPGTGHGGSGEYSYTATKPHTITVTSDVPETTTVTHTYTSTDVETITTFVPHSTPVATQETSTYYSSYLSVSYITKTVTHTSTGYEVICPITPSKPQYTSAGYESGYNHVYHSIPTPGSGHEASTVTDVYNGPSGPEQTYAPHTVYGTPAGSCAPAQTVYSTVVIEVTKTVEAPYGHKTHEAAYESHTSTVNPPYPAGHGNGTSNHQAGSGTVTIAQPSATGGYLYY